MEVSCIGNHYTTTMSSYKTVYVDDYGPMISRDVELNEMSFRFSHQLTTVRLEDTSSLEITNLQKLVGQKCLCMVYVFVTQPADLLVHGAFQSRNFRLRMAFQVTETTIQ